MRDARVERWVARVLASALGVSGCGVSGVASEIDLAQRIGDATYVTIANRYPDNVIPDEVCAEHCNVGYVERCWLGVDGKLPVLWCRELVPYPGGRRPEGYTSPSRIAGDQSGRWLAALAALESASVPAFLRLARELEAHGAPSSLVSGAHRAAADEVRHARVVSRWSRKFGVEPQPYSHAGLEPVRSLEEIATENAREGCVNEAFGAVLSAFQAAHATSAALRRTFHGIARDEAAHAGLAYDIHDWAGMKLDPASRRRVEEAKAAALSALRTDPSGPEIPALGVPGPAIRARLAASMSTFTA